MAMSQGSNEEVNSEINITPLADVMLVLLIIFMITAPMSSHQVKVTLPDATNPESEQSQDVPPLDLAVREDGKLFLDDSLVSRAQLKSKLMVMAQKSPQPPLQIRADKTVKYKKIRHILETAKGSGMVHVGFETYEKED